MNMNDLSIKAVNELGEFSKENTCRRFKKFRELVQPNIEELAEDVRSNTTRIKKIENGEIIPDVLTMRILSDLYGLSTNWLITGYGNMFSKKGRKTPEQLYEKQVCRESAFRELLAAMKNPKVEKRIFQEFKKIKPYFKKDIEAWKKENA